MSLAELLIVLCFVMVAATVAWIHGRRASRKWRRWSGGRCPRCGYDLRHQDDRCPECGRAVRWADEKPGL